MDEKRTESTVRIGLPRELKWFLGVSLGMWLMSIAYIAAKFLLYPAHHRGLPLGLLHQPPLPDISAMVGRLGLRQEEAFYWHGFVWSYPAPCIFLYKFLASFGPSGPNQWKYAILVYLLIVFAGLLLLMWKMAAALTRRGLVTLECWVLLIAAAALSSPIIFALHQGNLEAVIWIGLAASVWAYSRGMSWTSALLIGFLGSFKIYPLLLLGLFLRPRKYLQIAAALVVFAAMTLSGLAYIGPTVPIAFHRVSIAVAGFSGAAFTTGPVDPDFFPMDHSLLSLIRILTGAHPEFMPLLHRYYIPVAGALMTAFFFVFLWKKPWLNQLLVIVVAFVLLPPRSFEYTLESLYIPWGCLAMMAVSAKARGVRIPGLRAAMICLAIVCSPTMFASYHGNLAFGQFKAIFLLALIALAARYPFENDSMLREHIADTSTGGLKTTALPA